MTDSKVISNTPFWHDDIGFIDASTSREKKELAAHQQIVIVGSGFTALSAALTLARAGKSVSVFDSDDIGSGASSRNGGLLGPSFHKLGMQGLTNKYGAQTAQAVLKESLAGFDWLIDFINKEQISCDLQHCGRFRGAIKKKHFESISVQAQSLAKALDYPVEIIPKSQQHHAVGTDKYHGGVVYKKDASLHPAKLVSELIEKNLQAGVKFYPHCVIKQITRADHGFNLQAQNQQITAENVLIATNGYTSEVTQAFKRRILPIRSSMIATEELSEDLIRTVSPRLHSHGGTDRLVFYYRPSPDGKRLLFGGRAKHFADRPDEYQHFLQQSMLALFPQLKGVKLSNAWSGLVAYSFDHVPHLGKKDGLYYAMGYCGSGVARANYLGHKIALKMLGQGGDSIFDQFEFESRPLYQGNPWFMPSIIAWHSFADRLGL